MKPCGHTTVEPTCLACIIWERRAGHPIPVVPQAARVIRKRPKYPVPLRMATPCKEIGERIGDPIKCDLCGNKMVQPYQCRVHGECSGNQVLVSGGKRWQFCLTCEQYEPKQPQSDTGPNGAEPAATLSWVCGVTTVLSRRKELLPRTLESLMRAKFPAPRLFVDGEKDPSSWEREFGLQVTTRFPIIRTHGNWFLALHELFIRNPVADRYAVFQDDLICCSNLRAYLDACDYPKAGYWNLYTFPENQKLAPAVGQTGRQAVGWYRSNQKGKGAVALVFDHASVLSMLSSDHMTGRPTDAKRGWKAIDGGIVSSMRKAGRYEYVHNPSLVQHVGDRSSMGNGPHPKAESFRGEQFDATELLKEIGM